MGIDIGIGRHNKSQNEFLIPLTSLDNLLVVGDAASGKSTVIKHLFMSLVEETCFLPLLFDENYQFDRLLEYRDLTRDILLLEFGKDGFIINPLELINEETSDKRFITILSGIFKQSFNLNQNETYILEEYIRSFLCKEYEKPCLEDLGQYIGSPLDSLKIFKKTEVETCLSHLRTIFQLLGKRPIRDIFISSTNLNLEKFKKFPIIIKFKYINPSIRIFIKNLVLFQQILYKLKRGNKSFHLTMLDPLDNISKELFHFWKENRVNEGLIGTMASPFTKSNYLNFFDNIISLRITNEIDLESVRDKIPFKKEHTPRKLELGIFLVKLHGYDYEMVELDDYF